MKHLCRLDPWWSLRFLGLRALVVLVLTLPAMWWLGRLGYGVAALAVPLGSAWPYRHRLGVTPAGLEIRWLMLRALVPRSAIAAVELGPDPRSLALGPRRPVLRIWRHHRRPLLIWGPEAALSGLRAALGVTDPISPALRGFFP